MSIQPPDVLDAVETFFGEPLGRDVVRLSRTLPEDQATVLAVRIEECRARTLRWLRRNDTGLGRPADYVHVHDGLMARSCDDGPATEMTALKQMVLYFDRVAVAEPLFEWAAARIAYDEYMEAAHRIDRITEMLVADGAFLEDKESYSTYVEMDQVLTPEIGHVARLPGFLAGLNRIAPLVRTGCITLVPPASVLRATPSPPDDENVETTLWFLEDGWLWGTDPVLCRTLLERTGLVEPWQLETAQYRLPGDLVAAACWAIHQYIPPDGNSYDAFATLRHAVVARHPAGDATEPEVVRAAQLGSAQRSFGLAPVSSAAFGMRHLALLDEAVRGPLTRAPSSATAVRYQIPSLTDVTLAELVALRASEDVFAAVRAALASLAEVTAATPPDDSYDGYERRVREAAGDVVRPAHEMLARRLRRTRALGLLARCVTGRATSLVLGAGAHALPALGAAKGPTASAVTGLVTNRVRQRRQGLDVGVQLLAGLLDED